MNTVRALIIHEHSFLKLKRSKTDKFPGKWELPGGKAEKNERLISAVCREVREETGLNIFVINQTLFNGVHLFVCNIFGKSEVRLSSEHEKFKWVELTP